MREMQSDEHVTACKTDLAWHRPVLEVLPADETAFGGSSGGDGSLSS